MNCKRCGHNLPRKVTVIKDGMPNRIRVDYCPACSRPVGR